MDQRLAALGITEALNAYSPHANLDRARGQYRDPAAQEVLGPWEHRAFAREYAQESPVLAAASLPFAIPGYTAGKAVAKTPLVSSGNPMLALAKLVTREGMGLHKSRSPASLNEMAQGFAGLGEGLHAALQSYLGGGANEAQAPTNKEGPAENTQFDLNDPEQYADMMKRTSPEYNTPTRQLGDGTPYGPGAYAKMVRNQVALGGRGDPRLNRTLAEQVAVERKAAGLPSAEDVLARVFANRSR